MGSRLTGSTLMGELTARQQTCPPERPPKGGPTDRTLRDLASRLHELEPFPSSFFRSSPRPRASQQRGARVQEGRPDGSPSSGPTGFAPSISYSGRSTPIGAGSEAGVHPSDRASPSLSSGPPAEESANPPPMTPVHPGEAGARSPPASTHEVLRAPRQAGPTGSRRTRLAKRSDRRPFTRQEGS